MKIERRSTRLVFGMIDMPHWTEDRAQGICFENLYDTLYGYSFCFDPYLLDQLGAVPVLLPKKDLRKRQDEFDVLVSPSREVTEAFHSRWPAEKPALWVDPPPAVAASLCADSRPTWVTALKERLCFCKEHDSPAFIIERDFYTQLANGFWAFEPRPGDTTIGLVGERPIWLIRGRTGYASIRNLFRWSYSSFNRQNTTAFATGFARAVYAALGLPAGQVPAVRWTPTGLRQDFHAFGITLALLEFGLREGRHDTAELDAAHALLLTAARAAVQGKEPESRAALKKAFRILADIRQKHYPFDRGWIDIPHAGILGPEGGLAELEWPQLTRDYLAYMADMAETAGYRFALEYNAGSWVETARRHPEIVKRLARLWRAGQIEMVNGSWSGPLQQFTNIELAAREFELGQAAMEKLFGKSCETYACQEFSFLPSFPGLLRDFGYKRVIHATQNRGQTPAGLHSHFCWQGKDGRAITALGHHQLNLTKRGVNFYLEWPTMFIGCLKQGLNRLDSACMHDQSEVPFREEMARAERYAPVLGRHRTPADILPDGPDAPLPFESFAFERYTFEEAVHGPACDHWISVFEEILFLTHWITRVEKLAAAAGLDAAELRSVWEWLLYLESHDHILVPGGTSGDFYYGRIMEFNGPQFSVYKRNFGKVLNERRPAMEAILTKIEDQALARLGLKRLPAGRLPRTMCVYNPHPQPLTPGGWFSWNGADFQAEGEAVRLRTWKGRCYWTGTLPACKKVKVKSAPADALRWSTHPSPGKFRWRLRKGTEQSLVAVTRNAGVTLLPLDGQKSRFALKRVEYAGDSKFAVTRAVWSAIRAGNPETVVNVELIQLTDCPLVFVHADVTGFRPVGSHKEQDALRLRFTPAPRLKKTQYFVSHFTEDSQKRNQTSSPYVAQAETTKGTLSLFNRGGIWHVRQQDALDLVLMAPHEKVNHRDFAFAWNLENPVMTAIHQVDQPILVSGPKTPDIPSRAIGCEFANIWISSWRPDGQLRVSETEGVRTEAVLTMTPKISAVYFLGERGILGEKPGLDTDGNIHFPLNPYESVALRVVW